MMGDKESWELGYDVWKSIDHLADEERTDMADKEYVVNTIYKIMIIFLFCHSACFHYKEYFCFYQFYLYMINNAIP